MKLIPIFFVIVTLSFKASAQKNNEPLLNFKNSKGSIFNYWGPLKNGVPDGKGVALLNISNKYAFYVGEFKNGIREGQGMMHWASGFHYDGPWAGDTAGAGTAEYFVNSTGSYYKGSMQSLKFNGQGIFYFADGRMVTGEFKNNSQNGYCIYTDKSGGRYDGFFLDGKFDGDGVYTDSAGVKKEGLWKAGVLEKPGTAALPARLPSYKLPTDPYLRSYKNAKGNIFSYRGPVKKEMPDGNGVGIYYYASSQYAMYKGGFKSGDRHGKGDMYFHNGDFFSGEWANDSLKQGIYYYANGNRYEGSFVNNNREGKGKFYFLAGTLYDGDFKKNKYDGVGTYMSKDFTYTGGFKEDKYQGKGKMVQGAVVKDGDWEANVFKGKEQYVLPKGIKEFEGEERWMKAEVKDDLLTIFRSYNNSKLSSLKGRFIRKSSGGDDLYQIKEKITESDTLFLKGDTAIYSGSLGAVATSEKATEAFNKLENWLKTFLTKSYTTNYYTYTIHRAYPQRYAVFVDNENKASLSLYVQVKDGLYYINLALGKKEGYDDEDDEDWWF